ncbi:MAG: alanine racemase [Moraxellaceae bacterium]|nr:alanine racemase [Moraxellaceae bacterium]
MRTTTIHINSQALIDNINQVANLAPNSKIMLMYKANAYGHGIEVCTKILLKNQTISEKVQALGVATLEEALLIKKFGWQKNIVLIEGAFSLNEWQQAIKHNFQCVIHHQQQLEWALEKQPQKDSLTNTIWLKYNTGMNRLGFATEEIIPIAKQLDKLGYQQILISHFANADDKNHPLNAQQGERFSKKLTELQTQLNSQIQGSLCNSAGIIHYPQWHYDWVRAGIMVYGGSPIINKTAEELNLQAVMTFSCRIMAKHQLKKGDMVGYGSRWIADKDSRIGVISVGYGDGYPRVVDDTAQVLVHGKNGDCLCPIIGRVAMDMLMIDISHVAENAININDKVILWGDKPTIDNIADSANTIGYELLCRLTTRPKRKVDL